jgi:hypothetical protein
MHVAKHIYYTQQYKNDEWMWIHYSFISFIKTGLLLYKNIIVILWTINNMVHITLKINISANWTLQWFNECVSISLRSYNLVYQAVYYSYMLSAWKLIAWSASWIEVRVFHFHDFLPFLTSSSPTARSSVASQYFERNVVSSTGNDFWPIE